MITYHRVGSGYCIEIRKNGLFLSCGRGSTLAEALAAAEAALP